MADGGRRIVFASVPRSGSTWVRSLLEYATNISSEVRSVCGHASACVCMHTHADAHSHAPAQ